MRLFIMVVIIGCLAACLPLQPNCSSSADLGSKNSELLAAEGMVKAKKYRDAEAAYRKIIDEYPQSPSAAEALFESAHLRVYQDNPQKDYASALLAFEDFLKRFPHHPKTADAENWRGVLRAITDLKKENDHLNRNIEQLNKLDMRLEEKRGR